MTSRYSLQRVLFFLFVFLVYVLFYYHLFRNGNSSDLKGHLEIFELSIKKNLIPFPPLYYILLAVLKGCFSVSLQNAGLIILSLASGFKVFLTWIYWNENKVGYMVTTLLLISLTILFPPYVKLFDKHIYLGKFVSTIYHNSTLILAFPLSIILFLFSCNYLDSKRSDLVPLIVFFSFWVAMAKPSYLFSYIPSFFIFLVLHFRVNSAFAKNGILILFFCSLFVLIQYFLVYTNLDFVYTSDGDSRVVIAPFAVWNTWVKSRLFSLLSSFFLLAYLVIILFQQIKGSVYFKFASLNLFFSLLIYFLFCETGYRFPHSNFYWQIPVSIYLMYMVLFKYLFGNWSSISLFHRVIFFATLAVYTIYGAFYLFEILFDDKLFL